MHCFGQTRLNMLEKYSLHVAALFEELAMKACHVCVMQKGDKDYKKCKSLCTGRLLQGASHTNNLTVCLLPLSGLLQLPRETSGSQVYVFSSFLVIHRELRTVNELKGENNSVRKNSVMFVRT